MGRLGVLLPIQRREAFVSRTGVGEGTLDERPTDVRGRHDLHDLLQGLGAECPGLDPAARVRGVQSAVSREHALLRAIRRQVEARATVAEARALPTHLWLVREIPPPSVGALRRGGREGEGDQHPSRGFHRPHDVSRALPKAKATREQQVIKRDVYRY